jgi:chloramphenicol 3-O-phosphotransferase
MAERHASITSRKVKVRDTLQPRSAMGSVLIVSGPVGAGKTTVCRELIASASGPTAYIEGDGFWTYIVKPAAHQSTSERFRMIMRAMLAAARHYERDGYEAIVDFSIPPWYLDAVRALLKGCDYSYVVLRPSEALCASRAAARNEGTIPEYEPYHELYSVFAGFTRNTIANDDSDPALIAASIWEGFRAGAFRIFQ